MTGKTIVIAVPEAMAAPVAADLEAEGFQVAWQPSGEVEKRHEPGILQTAKLVVEIGVLSAPFVKAGIERALAKWRAAKVEEDNTGYL